MYHYIQLRSRALKCVEETAGWGSDDIYIGGVAIYHDFRTKLIPAQNMGSYDEGDSNQKSGRGQQKIIGMSMKGGDETYYPVKLQLGGLERTVKVRLFYHDPGKTYLIPVPNLPDAMKNAGALKDGKAPLRWPKFVATVLFLAEEDSGGFSGWLKNDLHPQVKKAAQRAKGKLLDNLANKAMAIDSFGDVFGDVFNVSGLLGKSDMKSLAVSAAKAGGPVLGDDISWYVLKRCTITSYGTFDSTKRSDSGDTWVTFKKASNSVLGFPAGFDGEYKMKCDWKKYN